MAAAEHGELPGIDAGRAIFAGLVDAQHRGDGPRIHWRPRVAGAPGWGGQAARGRFRLSHRITNAAPSERIAFQPAIETSEQGPLHLVAADQRSAAMICSSRHRARRRCTG